MFKKMIFAVFMVMLVSGTAMAGAIPTGQCDEGMPPNCVGQFTLNDLGSFDGDVWTWDAEFVATHGGQLEWTPECGAVIDESIPELITPADWQSCFEPQKVLEPFKIDNIRVDRRKYANSDKDHTRFTFRVTGSSEVIYIPLFWTDNPEANGLFMFFPGGLVATEASRIEVPAPTVTSTVWNGAFGTEFLSQRHEFMYMMKYNTNLRDWYHNYYEEYNPVYHYQFTEQLETVGLQTFTINFADGSSYDTTVEITNVDPMPTISAKSYYTDLVEIDKKKKNKSGKKIKATETTVEVDNITMREVDDPTGEKALVIQWSEPDGALFGNTYRNPLDVFMLRIYVGKYDETLKKEVYLWIDCPVQTGTVVIYGEHYNWLKDKIVAEGMTLDSIVMFILYRTITDYSYDDNCDEFGCHGNLENNSNPNYHNRGISDEVFITPSL